MRFCTACVLPDSRPGLSIGVDGICAACRAHGERPRIDWASRGAAFRRIASRAKTQRRGYDALVPVSGGKDSTWQVVKCLEAGLRVLAVTWKTPARTEIGRRNLENLVGLGVDHIDYQVSPRVEKIFLRRSFEKFGTTAIPMHMALFNIPLRLAERFRIPLVVWGEDSAVEYSGRNEPARGFRMDAGWLRRHGVTHGTTARHWVGAGLSEKDLMPYFGPSDKDLACAGVSAVFLGRYFPWDPLESLRIAKAHGFRPRSEGPLTGYYDYADIDDEFIVLHHWLKWYKFGFTRLFDNLALEIRNGRMTRDRALEIIHRRGDQTPRRAIKLFCRFVEKPEAWFYRVAESFRGPVWRRDRGVWTIPGFPVTGWRWR